MITTKTKLKSKTFYILYRRSTLKLDAGFETGTSYAPASNEWMLPLSLKINPLTAGAAYIQVFIFY